MKLEVRLKLSTTTKAPLVVITATGVETRAARRALPGVRVVNGGIALAKLRNTHFDIAIVCGVGGGLRAGVPTGTVIVASEILRPDGSTVPTDAELTAALAAGAHKLGFVPLVAPLVTSAMLLTGEARAHWAAKGYAAVDMESGMVVARRLAAVRVVLDTPERELSAEWLRPLTACMQPRLWRELRWLMRNAPFCARRAAEVIRAGFEL